MSPEAKAANEAVLIELQSLVQHPGYQRLKAQFKQDVERLLHDVCTSGDAHAMARAAGALAATKGLESWAERQIQLLSGRLGTL